MGHLYVNEELSNIPSAVGHVSSNCWLLETRGNEKKQLLCYDAARTRTFLPEGLVLRSSMNDIFVRLLTLTSYISRRFILFIEDLVFRDVHRCFQGSALSSSGHHSRTSCSSICESVLECCSTSSTPSDAGTTLSIHEERVSPLTENLSVNTSSEIVESYHGSWGVHFIFQGLMLPVLGLKLAWRLAFICCRCSFFHVKHTRIQVQSFISRVQRTLHGSSNDIGWLQCTPGVSPVEDGTSRFMELLQGIRNGEHSLPNSFVYLLIPGLFSNHGPLYFVNTKKFFSKMGLTCHIAKIHSEASVEHNAWELKQYIEELYWGSCKLVLMLGHSKGGVDAAAALSMYWSDLKDKVAGLALVQCPYGGTPIASDILREGQIADKEARRITEFLICKLIKGDIRALEDLTYEKRKEFIMKHKLPEHIPLVSFHTVASVAPGVLATLNHIAHAELPRLPLPSFGKEGPDSAQASCKVPVFIPLSAVMAASALHLKLRYGEKSDGVVTCRDAEVPGSVVVRPDRKLDHAWMVYSSWKKDLSEPDACEMCEAILTLLVEVGKMKLEHDGWSEF